MFTAQAATSKAATRVKDLKAILKLVATDIPVFPLWWEDTFVAHTKSVKFSGLTPLYYYQEWAKGVTSA